MNDKMNKKRRNVHNWLLAQLLCLNVSKTKLMMFHMPQKSHINYCILLWGTHYDKIFKLQKQAIHTISLNYFKAHTSPLFK